MNILYPNGKEKIKSLSEDTIKDLALNELIDMFSANDAEKAFALKVLSTFVNDVDTIVYRQEIIKDLLSDDDFRASLKIILKKIRVLREYRMHNHFHVVKKTSIWDMIEYMEEMDIYIQTVEELSALFERTQFSARGLKDISSLLSEAIKTDRLSEVKKFVTDMKADISTLKSVTVGINLDPELYPEEVIMISMNTVPYKSRMVFRDMAASVQAQREITYRYPSPTMKYLTADIEKELSRAVRKYKKALREHIDFKGYFLVDICDDLNFYLQIAEFGAGLNKKGLSISFPKISQDSDHVKMDQLYNLRLTKEESDDIVKNDISFSKNEKIYILTGPNRGGKTIMTQAVGMAALMAAQGLFIAGENYEGYTFCDILTHFPAEEDQTLNMGRLGEEAVRIRQIVKDATPLSLVLLNETYASTNAVDGLYLAKDLVRILKHKDVAAIYNTHLHELARSTDSMNEWDGNSDVVSLTMEMVDNTNTFKVLRAKPDTTSHARNVALKYGVTYDQMLNSRD